MERKEFIYEGKAKQVYSTEDPNKVIIFYKDDATAFNAQKRGTVQEKGIVNNKMTAILFKKLAQEGVPNHFIDQLSDREQLCHKVEIVPLEFVVRNVIAGSMAKRLGIEEGTVPPNQIIDICYKKDELGDPLINDDHAVALGAASYEDLKVMYAYTRTINDFLKAEFDKSGITLVDFKIEFGKDANGNILLADEISPDTCRLWDKETGKKMDKDRFRRDLGNVEEAYFEVLNRIS
ncbi:MAG: phosphoribosylaminoimidazolesuccinocarboxamide synthase [Saprospiraceae bacterium]|nr:phosphoribosylaminoimidazolesuccinocarboxamide synthase [Saprospiraceae bacterium]